MTKHHLTLIVWADVVDFLASTGAVVIYITAIVGAIISSITLYYTRKGFRRTSLAEAIRLLNDTRHREARKVIYGEITIASYEILGLSGPAAETGATSEPHIIDLCRNIVRSDFNEIATLVHYNLLDGRIFVQEYYWVILKIWHLLEGEIMQRRKTLGPTNYMEHLEEMRNEALEYARRHHEKVYQEFNAPADKPAENGKK